jgi:hypothetical protein
MIAWISGKTALVTGEETGLIVEPGRLLYVCDHPPRVVHITFEARRIGGKLGAASVGRDTRPIRGVEFVGIDDLPSLGSVSDSASSPGPDSPAPAATWAEGDHRAVRRSQPS